MAADEAFGGFGDEADAPEAGADADLAALSSGPDSALPSNFNPIVARLRRAWIAEKTCPELLDFETDAVEGLKAALAAQQQIVDAAGTGGAGVPTLSGPAKAIYREDIERVRYLLAAYTRTRFAKVRGHAVGLQLVASSSFGMKVNQPRYSFGIAPVHADFRATVFSRRQ